MNEEIILKRVKKVFKENIEYYKINSQGCGNLVIEINNEWIFRFSKSVFDIKQLQLEKAFLPEFEKLSPIAIPSITYKDKDFIGYKKINGTPLEPGIFKELGYEKREEICKQMGEFLKILHSIKFSHKNLVENTMGDNDFWNDIWKVTIPHLSIKTQENAFDYFTDYFKNEQNYQIEKTICHGDFHPNHILFNETELKISGIIDFGRLGIYDPAIDFNLIARFYGEDILNSVLKNYNQNISENFKKRITFQKFKRLFWMIGFANKIGQENSISRYIKRVEDAFCV